MNGGVGRSSDETYAAAAEQLAAQFEALSTEALLAPVLDLLPPPPARLADIGAGTGRDAAWLAARGHDVLAIEPVDELRTRGERLHPSARIAWQADRLPDLAGAGDARFAAILAIAVWHHVAPADRPIAMARLAELLEPGGRLILSLRHGRIEPGWPVHPCDPAETIALGEAAGMRPLRRIDADSAQPHNRAAGVAWTWLVLGAS